VGILGNSLGAPVVRVQAERGTMSISTGLTQIVRHPHVMAYHAVLLRRPAVAGLVVGSLDPHRVFALLFAVRTGIGRSARLAAALPDYADTCPRVALIVCCPYLWLRKNDGGTTPSWGG